MNDAKTLTPAEVKERLGLTTKQLRLYGDKGLIKPRRKEGGWRVFNQDDLARLYQIKVLRNFGFSLEQIATLLNARGRRADGFASIVRLQADALRQEQGRVTTALELLGNAQRQLDQGKQLDADGLVKLSELASLPAEHEIMTRLRPYIARYLNERDFRAATQASANNWQTLIDEAAALQARDPDPASVVARDLLERFDALRRFYSGGDEQLEKKSAQMFDEAMNHPDPATHPIPARVWEFLKAIKQSRKSK